MGWNFNLEVYITNMANIEFRDFIGNADKRYNYYPKFIIIIYNMGSKCIYYEIMMIKCMFREIRARNLT